MSNKFGACLPDSVFSSGIKFKLGHVERVFNDDFDLNSYDKNYEKTFTYPSQIVEFSPYSKSTKSNRRKRYRLAHPLFRGFSDSITHGDFAQAIDYNPGSPLIYAAFVWIFLVSLKDMATKQFENFPRIPRWLMQSWLLITCSIFAWLFWERMIVIIL